MDKPLTKAERMEWYRRILEQAERYELPEQIGLGVDVDEIELYADLVEQGYLDGHVMRDHNPPISGRAKTFTAVNFIYRLVKYAGARRVLFLVDRGNLGEPMLKELEKKRRQQHAAWTEDNLWNAFASAKPGKVKGRSQAGRFADLVALVRFALEQQPMLEPFADSVNLQRATRLRQSILQKAFTGELM